METLDKAIRCIQAEMRRDPKADISKAALSALMKTIRGVRKQGWTQEEQSTVFTLFGEAAQRLAKADAMTNAILEEEAEVLPFVPRQELKNNSSLPQRKPVFSVIQGGRTDDLHTAPTRQTNHLYVIHGGLTD